MARFDPGIAGPPGAMARAAERDRLARLRAELARDRIGAALLLDSVNLRYACGARNMQINTMRNPGRYVFVPAEGPVVLFEYAGCAHLSAGLGTVDEVRDAHALAPFYGGAVGYRDHLARFVGDIAALMHRHAPGCPRLALDRPTPDMVPALTAAGLTVLDVTAALDRARAIKTPNELALIRASVACTEAAVAAMERQLAPGRSEAQVWSEMHQALIAGGGEYIETRLFTSGSHTNPWFQETSDKPIAAGELVALDTDAIGCHGYYTDFSRTFLAGDGKPSPAQKRLYGYAFEQLEHNIALLAPGLGFRDFAERAWAIPPDYMPHRYLVSVHGNGLAGEYPLIRHLVDWDAVGEGGHFQAGMTVCVESFIGHRDGGEGVKLEEQVLITETGLERLSTYGYDDRLTPG